MLILALSAYNSKMGSETLKFHYRIVISMATFSFLQD